MSEPDSQRLNVSSPAVTVIICTWNRAELLRTTLESLAQQKGVAAKAVEVLVVDNNSTDSTHAVVQQAAVNWPLGHLRYLFQARQGKQFALNLGVQEARHEVLAFTDDDILFPQDWLYHVQSLFQDPGVDLAGGKTLIDWTGIDRPRWYCDDLQAVMAGVDDGDQRLDPAPLTFAPGGANLIARKSTFARFGPYSESHFRHMDHEFGIRCQRLGARVVYEPSLVVKAPVDERCLTERYFKRWSFKAGIARTGGIEAAGKRPSVPAWMYRRLLEDAVALAFSFGPETSDRFARRMRLWRDCGAVANAWHAWVRPKAHADWVQNRSQKKAGLY